jgi:hypothetical protein
MIWLQRWRLLVVAISLSTQAQADTWAPPAPKTYVSSDQRSRLRVMPRRLDGNLAYFEDKVAKREPAGQAAGEKRRTAEAILERLDAAGRWTTVWHKPLVNEVAPVNALISNDGSHVITFDNWHSNGLGTDVVVVYGADGSLIRSLALPDLLPSSYIKALPRSVSSIWWGGEHRLSVDGRKLILQIVIPSENRLPGPRDYAELPVDLATGMSEPSAGVRWPEALAKARATAAAIETEEAAAKAAFIAPLIPSASSEEVDWNHYLQEAFFRLDPEWEENYPSTQVLRAPGSPDYAPSKKWLRDALLDKHASGIIAIGSIGHQKNLLAVLEEVAPKIRRGALVEVRLYIASPVDHQPRISAALANSGATIVYLDPDRSIPQRPERIERFEAGETD